MTRLYVVECWFRVKQGEPQVRGLAVCSDPDTPVTFIYPDGTPYTGKNIWTYDLIQHSPWAMFELTVK